MSRSWNHKSIIDRLVKDLWNAKQADVIEWINEIQDDIATKLPIDFYKFKMKKLLPTETEIVSLSPTIPDAPTVAIVNGGDLIEGTKYKVYVTFKIKNIDGTKTYIESEASEASVEVTATAADKTIDLTDLVAYPGDVSVKPADIYRLIYVAKKEAGETTYGEPFFLAEISNNEDNTYSATAEPSSTRTPPSDTEVDQITSDHLIFATGNRWLQRINSNQLKRFDPNQRNTTTPDAFDFEGLDKILLYGKLSSDATTAQRTLEYSVYRRPHESFYDIDQVVDLPIQAKIALIAGVAWKGWEFKDRAGWVSKRTIYIDARDELIDKLTRQRGAPGSVRDVNGDSQNFEV